MEARDQIRQQSIFGEGHKKEPVLKGGLSKMPIEVKHVIEKHAIKEGIESRKQEKD